MSDLTPYERIIRAEKRGTGMRLSPEEVWVLAHDKAIQNSALAAKQQRVDEAAELKRWVAASRVVLRKKGEL